MKFPGQVKCPGGCRHCGRRCNGTSWGRQTHRFDCCGVMEAHVPVPPRRKDDPGWHAYTYSPGNAAAGYLTGPSTTTRPESAQGVLATEGSHTE